MQLDASLNAAAIPHGTAENRRNRILKQENDRRNKENLTTLIKQHVTLPDQWVATAVFPRGTDWLQCARDNPLTFEWDVHGHQTVVRFHRHIRRWM